MCASSEPGEPRPTGADEPGADEVAEEVSEEVQSPRIVLTLEIEQDEQLRGTIGTLGGAPISFEGWVGLMAAVDRLRTLSPRG
jgi:hypothetical protein